MAGDCMQLQSAVRLAAMQENGHAGNRDMCHNHCKNKYLPSTGASKAIRQKINYSFNKCAQNNMYSIVNVRFVTYIAKLTVSEQIKIWGRIVRVFDFTSSIYLQFPASPSSGTD